jgi:broad specificity phosphatase PhoE
VTNVFAIRHGETAWSISRQHTGVTDIPLTDTGRRLAQGLRPLLARERFDCVLVSPLQRTRETEYEGLTPQQIRDMRPGWMIFRDGCPRGESPEQIGVRVDRVIDRARRCDGNVALFSHGHLLRVLAARWIGLSATGGQYFLLGTGTLCVLGYYRDVPAVKIWNGPIATCG